MNEIISTESNYTSRSNKMQPLGIRLTVTLLLNKQKIRSQTANLSLKDCISHVY